MISRYDSQFNKIENLKWLPWVGDSYETIEMDRRLLIVGESHYHDNAPKSIEEHNSPTFTRVVIRELAMKQNYRGIKIFPNLHRALLGSDEIDSGAFYNLVSFYNFIQRPMETRKERPSRDDFSNAWSAFFEVVKVLKPKLCLFLGTTAANTLGNAINKGSDYSTNVIVWEDKIGNARPKSTTIKGSDGNETLIIFIRHTSQMFSWRKWHDYLQNKIGPELVWLAEQVTRSKS